jgi:superfamily II DNA or RNA helicase
MNTYLGQKGYTILKSEISVERQKQIKTDLTIRPYTPGAPPSQNTFPAYRESGAKLYVPHYYGVEQFGCPKENKVSEGMDTDLVFNGLLRDYQIPVVEKFVQHVIKDAKGSSGGLLELPCAWGKTSASLCIMTRLKKKTIVIVHKEFLMNQWIERIGQFVPGARIGKIQGQTIDVEDKDIVLCMLQSLINKEYPASIFDSFGLTIIDEVHHISSQTFSNSLFKVVTKYMLGLSATMDRKDGTTKVFKMFLGPVVHKVERKSEHEVEVRALTYRTNDADFNETILDFKGQPQISSMISKLSAYNRRTEFVIKTLVDFTTFEKSWAKSVATESVATESVATESVATESVATGSFATESVATESVATESVATGQIGATGSECIVGVTEQIGATESVTTGQSEEKQQTMFCPTFPKSCCQMCNKNINYLVKNTCCGQVKFCLLCMDRVVKTANETLEETTNKKTGIIKTVKRRPKCPCCNKVLAYEQHYIDTGLVKPISQLQTIVLSHNLNVLEYIYQKFVCKNLASVGYYVGGMSEQELKASEQKHVILATYSMASEGLDIPGLNAEFLISPKTDIVQSVGRILRAKHAITKPVIYDFIDTHDVFQRQWLKRKAFYKKQNYKIIATDSSNYNTNFESWQTILIPKNAINKDDSTNNPKNNLEEDEECNHCFFKPMVLPKK